MATPLDHLSIEMANEADNDQLIYLHRSRNEALATEVLQEFLAADIIVIGVGLYNLSVASQLKAWIDRIIIPNKTFQYTANGAAGLCNKKRVILTVAREQSYRQSVFLAPTEHAEAYFRSVFEFLGIDDVEVIVAEGLATGTLQKLKIIDRALQEVRSLS